MENLLKELETIEDEHKEFFNNNIKLSFYLIITKKPVMLEFNNKLNVVFRLPKEIHDKVNALIMNYYGL